METLNRSKMSITFIYQRRALNRSSMETFAALNAESGRPRRYNYCEIRARISGGAP